MELDYIIVIAELYRSFTNGVALFQNDSIVVNYVVITKKKTIYCLSLLSTSIFLFYHSMYKKSNKLLSHSTQKLGDVSKPNSNHVTLQTNFKSFRVTDFSHVHTDFILFLFPLDKSSLFCCMFLRKSPTPIKSFKSVTAHYYFSLSSILVRLIS